MNQKVGRNDPCPCGSGKKYKKCCELRLSSSKKKFQATVISSGMSGGTSLKGKASKISTDFFSRPPPAPPEKDLSDLRKNLPHHPPEADKPM